MKLLLLPLWLVCCVLSFPKSGWALPSFQPEFQNKEIDLGVQGVSYINKANAAVSDEKTGKMGAKLGGKLESDTSATFFTGIEGEGLYGLGSANYRYVDIAQAYVGMNLENTSLYLGRKKFQWSAMDSNWPLGLFQPRFRWDYLSEREDGLFGAFVHFHPNNFIEFTAYGSPIFIPETGAPFAMKNGECKTASPWFSCPSSTLMLFNQPTPVRFNLAVPPISNLISHPGYGATLRLGKLDYLYTRLSFVRKPMNQFALAYDGQLDLSNLDLPATIHPRVIYHKLFSADVGYTVARSQLTASFIAERPERDETPAFWNTQEVSNANLIGASWKTPAFWDESAKTNFEVSYFHREGGVAPDRGPFVQTGTSIFEPRYTFKNAYNFAIYTPIFQSWSNQFLLASRFIWDTVYNGNALIADLYFYPWKAIRLNLGLDALGSDNKTRADFLSRYQTNDRIRGGLTYVF